MEKNKKVQEIKFIQANTPLNEFSFRRLKSFYHMDKSEIDEAIEYYNILSKEPSLINHLWEHDSNAIENTSMYALAIKEYRFEECRKKSKDPEFQKEGVDEIKLFALLLKEDDDYQTANEVFDIIDSFIRRSPLVLQDVNSINKDQEKETNSTMNSFKFIGDKIDLIRILYALRENAKSNIVNKEGKRPDIKDFMIEAGNFFGMDLSDYTKSWSRALDPRYTSEQANKEIFEAMLKAVNDKYIMKLK